MNLVHNFPCFSILFSMIAAFISSAVSEKKARFIAIGLSILVCIMSFAVILDVAATGESFVYVMGAYPAPWGNEIRAGLLEAGIALLFGIVTCGALLAGSEELQSDEEDKKGNLLYIMVELMMAANLALVYTNDLFTAYVFVEISTITACGLIISKYDKLRVVAGVRYMLMSLLGSGLLLFGICFMYSITGQLLMTPINEAIAQIISSREYYVPFLFSVGMMSVGLAIKSALWPFSTWLPSAYAYSTTASSAILSSIVSKGYIILLIKLIVRVVGVGDFANTNITDLLFVFGIAGMIIGSLDAIRQKSIKRMVAYSSVAQIGYIFMGIGLGSVAGLEASCYHIFAHSTAKSLAFIAAAGLVRAAGEIKNVNISRLRGMGYRNKLAGVGFVAASLSMIGIPGFGGFVSKVMFAQASLETGDTRAAFVLAALAISTLLNAIYFMKVVLTIYRPLSDAEKAEGKTYGTMKNKWQYSLAVVLLIVTNLIIGIGISPMSKIITEGIAMFK